MEPLLKLPVHRPLLYHLAGKFESLTDGWTHASRTLTDYELIVVSSGTVSSTSGVPSFFSIRFFLPLW